MNPLDQLRDEIANLHLLADRLARKSAPYHDLVEAADAMRALFPKAAHDCLLRECSIVDAYDTVRDLCLASRSPSHDLVEAADAMYARLEEKNDDSRYSTRELLDSYDRARARYAEGAQASGAPAKWRVEVVHGRARLIVDASGDSGEQSFWINDADTDDEPGHAEFHARMLRIAIGRIVGAPAPASAQGEVCEKPDAASPVKPCEYDEWIDPIDGRTYELLGGNLWVKVADDPLPKGERHMVSPRDAASIVARRPNRRAPDPSPVKPCPWCDELPIVLCDDGTWTVQCDSGSCSVTARCEGETAKDAVATWNRRTPAPSPATGESAIDKALDPNCWDLAMQADTLAAARAELASLRAEVERLRGAASVDPVGYVYQRRDDPANVVIRGVAEMGGDIDMYPESWKRIGPVFSTPASVDVSLVKGLVEACERWARSTPNDLIAMHESGTLQPSGFSDAVKDLVPRIVDLRTALGAKETK